MLFDPRWEVAAELRADPLTLPALIAWLERQPAWLGYWYVDPCCFWGGCLIYRYLDACGLRPALVNSEFWRDRNDREHPLPAHFNAVSRAGAPFGWGTYGAALDRARAIAA